MCQDAERKNKLAGLASLRETQRDGIVLDRFYIKEEK